MYACSHLEGTSGLFSVIKCIMMLERRVMLPNADFHVMNPNIEGRDRLKVRVCDLCSPMAGRTVDNRSRS